MNPMAIRPVMIMLIPNPRRPVGTSAYHIFFRIAAMETMANIQPMPEPMLKTTDSRKV